MTQPLPRVIQTQLPFIHVLAAIPSRFFPLHKTRLEIMAVIIIGPWLSRTANGARRPAVRAA